MKIKAISLYQPWASLIAVGAKKYETRSWTTRYRGPLLICASANEKAAKIAYNDPIFRLVANHYIRCAFLPYGQAVAIVDLTDCLTTIWLTGWPEKYPLSANEKLFGDFSTGRYAWRLENVRTIEPFPVKGRQGLFEVELSEGLLP